MKGTYCKAGFACVLCKQVFFTSRYVDFKEPFFFNAKRKLTYTLRACYVWAHFFCSNEYGYDIKFSSLLRFRIFSSPTHMQIKTTWDSWVRGWGRHFPPEWLNRLLYFKYFEESKKKIWLKSNDFNDTGNDLKKFCTLFFTKFLILFQQRWK